MNEVRESILKKTWDELLDHFSANHWRLNEDISLNLLGKLYDSAVSAEMIKQDYVPIDIVESMYLAMGEAHSFLSILPDKYGDRKEIENKLHDSFRTYEKWKEDRDKSYTKQKLVEIKEGIATIGLSYVDQEKLVKELEDIIDTM